MALKPYDVRAIKLPGFVLDEQGLHVVGRPNFEQYQGAGDFIKRTHQASGWWLADWIKYGESRSDWSDRLDAELGAEAGVTEQTVRNYRRVSKAFPPEARVEGVSFAHHAAVAGAEPAEARQILSEARTEGWTAAETQKQWRARKRTKIIEGQALLEGMYRVIYADPPWSYNSSSGANSGAFRTAAEHYPVMDIDALCKLPVKAHALPNSVLFLWVTSPMLMDNPGPRELIEAWGFTYKSSIVWDKVRHNFGHYVAVHHEFLLICTRGSCLPDNPVPMPDSVQVFKQQGEHSEKPEEFRKLIDRLYTTGPKVELFARRRAPVEGWDFFGNDARLWADEAAS